MNNPFFRKIRGQNLIKVVSGIIRPKLLYAYTKLSFDHVMKVWKRSAHIRFLFKKKDPRHMSTIINKHNKPASPRNIRNLRWPPNITMNKRKRNRSSFIANWKGSMMMLCKFTNFTMKALYIQFFSNEGNKTLSIY